MKKLLYFLLLVSLVSNGCKYYYLSNNEYDASQILYEFKLDSAEIYAYELCEELYIDFDSISQQFEALAYPKYRLCSDITDSAKNVIERNFILIPKEDTSKIIYISTFGQIDKKTKEHFLVNKLDFISFGKIQNNKIIFEDKENRTIEWKIKHNKNKHEANIEILEVPYLQSENNTYTPVDINNIFSIDLIFQKKENLSFEFYDREANDYISVDGVGLTKKIDEEQFILFGLDGNVANPRQKFTKKTYSIIKFKERRLKYKIPN
jgi:hypothetical protein